MPEGDTIHRTAARLRVALEGRALVRLELPRRVSAGPPPGTGIERVEAKGKHLLMAFADGHVLHSHLGMHGSWRLAAPTEPRGTGARAVVAVADAVAICRSAPIVELLDASALRRHPLLRALGPDLASPDPDLVAVMERLGRMGAEHMTVASALLDQRVASGIGNVYASEVCFLHHLHPHTPLRAVDAATMEAMFATASALLRDNLHTQRRTTVTGAAAGSLYVYGRQGKACRRCGDVIVRDPPLVGGRVTYHCPGCQPPPTQAR